jgi:hypothetical protein
MSNLLSISLKPTYNPELISDIATLLIVIFVIFIVNADILKDRLLGILNVLF